MKLFQLFLPAYNQQSRASTQNTIQNSKGLKMEKCIPILQLWFWFQILLVYRLVLLCCNSEFN